MASFDFLGSLETGFQRVPEAPCRKGLGLGFEIIDIRRFEAKDFATLLQSESQAWYEKLRWDFTSSAQVINACLREKGLSGYALVHEGGIRGYCFFFYDGEKGLIGDLFVHPELAGLTPARELLEHVVETLLGTPGLRRVETQLPHFELEDLEPCFRPHEFQGYLRRFMSVPLANRPRLAAGRGDTAARRLQEASLESFQLIPWDRRLDEEAAELIYYAYRRHVDATINDQYASVTGASRLITNIVHHQGCGEFLSRISRMAVHRSTQQLAGILSVTRIRPHTAHIPQVAVAESFQGRGVGSALMEAAFRDLAREGFEEATLAVTDQNAGAVRLYQRVGFQTFKTFGAFVFSRQGGPG
jgi:ribosomal protein S18 acetylase RimI-like enzyme